MKAIIYGAGSAGKKTLEVYKDYFEIVAFVDKDKEKEGNFLEGYPIYYPSEELLHKYLVLVGTTFPEVWENLNKLAVKAIPYELTFYLHNVKFDELTKKTKEIELENKNVEKCNLLANRDEMLKKLPQNSICAEIGVNKGDFSSKILEICNPKKLYLIDYWENTSGEGTPDAYYMVLNKFKKQIETGQVVVIKAESVLAMKQMENKSLDFAYLDTVHTYEHTSKELSELKRIVKKDGLIMGHDYIKRATGSGWRMGVVDAVNEFCMEENYTFIYKTMETYGHHSFALKKIEADR